MTRHIFSLLFTTLALAAAESRLGSSIQALFGYGDTPITQTDIDQLGASHLASFEMCHPTFTGRNQPAKKLFLDMLHKTGKRAQSYHLPFGNEVDISLVDENARRKAVQALDFYLKDAASFGCEYVVLHASDGPIPDETRAARIAAARKSLAELAAHLVKLNLKLAVELLPYDCLGNTPQELKLLLKGLPREHFGVVVDLNHGVGKPTTAAENILLLREHILGLHICDHDGNEERHWMPGYGVVDFAKAAAALREIGYQGFYNYESAIPGATVEERCRNVTENFRYHFHPEAGTLFHLARCAELPLAYTCRTLPDLATFTDLTKVASAKVIKDGFDRGGKDWELPKGFTIASRMGINGTDALCYTRTDPDDYPILSRPISMDKDTTYTFRFQFRTEDMSVYSGKTEIRYVASIEYYEKDKWIAGVSSDANGAHLINQPWKEVVLKTRPPRSCDYIRLIFYLESNYVGKIYYDNVVIEPESKVAAEIYDCRPGNLALGKDGYVAFRASLLGSEQQNQDDLAMLATVGGRTKLLANSDGLYADEFGEFSPGDVDVKAVLLNLRHKTIITTKSFKLNAAARKHMAGASEIDGDGYTRVDGRKFLPIGFFGDNLTDSDMARLQDAGVNFYMPYTSMFMGKDGEYVKDFAAVENTMDCFHRHGIKVLFALNGQNPSQGSFVRREYDGVQGIMEISEAFVRRLGSHPAMLGYYLSDENPTHELPYIRSVREMTARTDPNHFTVTLTFIPDDFPFYAYTGDVLAVDNYPIDDNLYPSITPIYDVMKSASKLKIATWFVPQAFSWGCFKNLKPEQTSEFARYPFPTENQLRAMTLAAAISGAKGFLFYNYHSIFMAGEKFMPGSGELNWKQVTPVIAMLREFTPFLLSDSSAPEISIRSIAPQKIEARAWRNGQGLCVAITGNGPGISAAIISVPGHQNLKSKYGLTQNLGGGRYHFSCSGINADVLY